jgi:Glycosyltransferase family 87
VSAKTAGAFVLFLVLALGLLARAYRQGLVVYEVGTDFSSFWLAAMWVRERPDHVPLYYPTLADGRPNDRIWTTAIESEGEAYEPWYVWGRLQGFDQPKFYLYPPVFAAAFVPLTYLPLREGVLVWQLANTLCFIAAVAFLGALIRPRRIPTALWASAILAFSLPFYPVTWSQELGQNSLSLFLGWVLLLSCLLHRREIAGGSILAALTLVKLNPVLLVPWLAWRRFHRMLLAAACTAALFMGASVIATGWSEVRTYFTEVVPVLSAGTAFHENQSFLGVLHRSRSDLNPMRPLSAAGSPAGRVPHRVFTLVLFGAQVLSVLAARAGQRTSLVEEYCGFLLVILMSSPVSWSHHLVVAIIPLVALASRLIDDGGRRSLLPALALAAVYLLVGVPLLFSSPWWLRLAHEHRLLLSARFFGVALLWGCLQWVVFRLPREAPATTSATGS